MSLPLERAPDGSEPTSNRAELRAVIGALTMRIWPGEGFFKLVIGTDSEYVVKGVTEWCQKWKANGWKTASGTSVKNQDLWKLLLEKIEGFEGDGTYHAATVLNTVSHSIQCMGWIKSEGLTPLSYAVDEAFYAPKETTTLFHGVNTLRSAHIFMLCHNHLCLDVGRGSLALAT
jgi:hypothetical protein